VLDLKWIRENPADFDQGLARRGIEALSTEIIRIDTEVRAIKKDLQEKQAERNELSKNIGKAKSLLSANPIAAKDLGWTPATVEVQMDRVAKLKVSLSELEADVRRSEQSLKEVLACIPNMLLPAPEVPDGKDESENVELRRVGTPRDFAAEGFAPKQHFEVGEALGLMDFEAAAKISGARFTVLKGSLARLERALGQFMLDVQTSEHGYTEVNPPLLVRDRALYGTAQLPKFEDDLYKAAGTTSLGEAVGAFADEVDVQRNEKTGRQEAFELYWLIPTAEVPLTNLVRESILAEADLPLRFTALTPCFRAEAGAAGRDTRGMIRQHQFYKVEMVSITAPHASPAEHERMTGCAEEILKRLGLPYRVVVLCAGDTGFGARKTHDLEVWLPGQGAYREISSVSNCGDFQARRMQARFRPSAAKDVQFVHTLNGSGLAVGRALIAVIENYQEADGSIRVPDALLPYMGGVTRVGA